jgi:hypothetical protein
MLTLIVGLDASGKSNNLAPLSKRYSLTPSTVVTRLGGAACRVDTPTQSVDNKPNVSKFAGIEPESKPMRNIEESRLRIAGILGMKMTIVKKKFEKFWERLPRRGRKS